MMDEDTDESDETFRNCRKVLQAGIWLLQNGFGRMQLLPYVAPSGCYWRCEFHPPGRPSRAFYKYTTGSGTRYLENHCGGSVRQSISPKSLAAAIMKSVPEDAQASCRGVLSADVAAWVQHLDRVLQRGLLPAAFHEYTMDYSRWDLYRPGGGPIEERFEPQPGYLKPGVDLHWSQMEFWRAADRTLSGVVTVELEPLEKIDRIAEELWHVMREISVEEATQALRAAASLTAKR